MFLSQNRELMHSRSLVYTQTIKILPLDIL